MSIAEISNYHFNQEVTGISAQLSNTFKTIFGHEHDLVYGFENESIRPVEYSMSGVQRVSLEQIDFQIKLLILKLNVLVYLLMTELHFCSGQIPSYDLEPTPELYLIINVSR